MPETARSVLAARLGMIYVTVDMGPAGTPVLPTDKLIPRLTKAFEKDPRISKVTAATKGAEERLAFSRFVELPKDFEDLLDGPVHKFAPTFGTPFKLVVKIPAKNQLTSWTPQEDLPETYLVRWNGSSLMVFWEQPANERIPDAGQTVKDVIEDCVKAAGLKPTLEGPTFAHVGLKVQGEPGATGLIWFTPGKRLVEVQIPGEWNSERLADLAFGGCEWLISNFYRFANRRSQIFVLDVLVQSYLEQLLSIQRQRTALRLRPLKDYVRHRRALWRWRHRSRELLAGIWLGMVQIQGGIRRFSDDLRNYDEVVADGQGLELFEVDRKGLEHDVRSVDISFVQRSAEETRSRLDNRDLVLVTAFAAVVAVLIGAIVGAWLSHLTGVRVTAS